MYILIKSLILNNTFHDKVNPLVHSVQYIGRLAKFLFLFWKGSSKKIPMNVLYSRHLRVKYDEIRYPVRLSTERTPANTNRCFRN